MMISLLWASLALAGSADARAVHTGVWTGDSVHWYSVIQHGSAERLELAEPLPATVQVVRGEAVRDADGRIVALANPLHRCCSSDFELVQPGVAEGSATLAPPIVDLPGVQRVAVTDLVAEPGPELGLQRHIRGWWAPGVDRDARRATRRLARLRPDHKPREQAALYVRGSDVRSRGLPVTLMTQQSVKEEAVWKIAAAFGGLLGLLFLLFKGLAEAERREKNAWYIDNRL